MRSLDATQIRPPPQCDVKIEVSRFLNLIHIRLVCLDIDVAVNDKGCWVLCAISKVFLLFMVIFIPLHLQHKYSVFMSVFKLL